LPESTPPVEEKTADPLSTDLKTLVESNYGEPGQKSRPPTLPASTPPAEKKLLSTDLKTLTERN
jgi:hypothetical protein